MVMFKRKDGDCNEFDTLIGESTVFEGNIQSENTIRVDGRIDGDIKAGGSVFVGNNAIVKGNITAKDIYISGQVEGNITSNGILKLSATAKLYGDIQVYSFVADEGGIFQGKCSMLEVPKPDAPATGKGLKKGLSDEYKKSTLISAIYDDREKGEQALSE